MKNLTRIALLPIALLFANYGYSDSSLTPKGIENQSKQNIHALFSFIKSVNAKPSLFTEEAFNTYFANKFTYEINGKVAATNYDELKKRWDKILNEYPTISIQTPVTIINAKASSLIVDYKVEKQTKDHLKLTNHITALIQFKNGRIKSWQGIVSQMNENS